MEEMRNRDWLLGIGERGIEDKATVFSTLPSPLPYSSPIPNYPFLIPIPHKPDLAKILVFEQQIRKSAQRLTGLPREKAKIAMRL